MLNDCSNKVGTLLPRKCFVCTACGWNLMTFEWRRRRELHVQISCLLSVTQSCLTLCNPMNCSPPGSSVHGILQARILLWVVVILFSRGSSQPRDQTWVSHIAGRFFTVWATRKPCAYTLPCYSWVPGDPVLRALQWGLLPASDPIGSAQFLPQSSHAPLWITTH